MFEISPKTKEIVFKIIQNDEIKDFGKNFQNIPDKIVPLSSTNRISMVIASPVVITSAFTRRSKREVLLIVVC